MDWARLRFASESPAMTDAGGVYFEIVTVGQTSRISAIHEATGVEVSAMGPASAARSDLERLALRKLEAKLARRRN